MTSNAAVVIPFETGSKLEEWLEWRAKELTQADIRLRLAVAGLAAMRRDGWLTRSQKAKPVVLPHDDSEEDLLRARFVPLPTSRTRTTWTVPPRAINAGGRALSLVHNADMDADLQAIKAALAELADAELHTLINAANRVPRTALGLSAWIDDACYWEVYRRRGFDFTLQPPEAAIPPEEDAVSIDAAIAMRARFAQDSPAAQALFDALVELLTGGERKH